MINYWKTWAAVRVIRYLLTVLRSTLKLWCHSVFVNACLNSGICLQSRFHIFTLFSLEQAEHSCVPVVIFLRSADSFMNNRYFQSRCEDPYIVLPSLAQIQTTPCNLTRQNDLQLGELFLVWWVIVIYVPYIHWWNAGFFFCRSTESRKWKCKPQSAGVPSTFTCFCNKNAVIP